MAIKIPYSVINQAVHNVCDKRRNCLFNDDYDFVDTDFLKSMVFEMRDYFLSDPKTLKWIMADLELALFYEEHADGFLESVKDFMLEQLSSHENLSQIGEALADYRRELNSLEKDLAYDRFQSL